jgi:glutamyl-tRNA synthetase
MLSWLNARLNKGRFILRIDDLDSARNRPGALGQILEDLRWLGIDWDEGPDIGGEHGPYLQSQRLQHYESAFLRLQQQSRVFPCRCSRKDIALAVSAPHPDQPTRIYPGTCRPANPADTTGKPRVSPSDEVSWRYRVGSKVVCYVDKLRGRQQQHLGNAVGDFVVKRRDGLFAYHLATVVDDGLMGVKDVLRGEDLLDSTPRQIELMNVLDLPVPDFWHVPLLLDDSGQRMSKRDGSNSLEQWLEKSKSPSLLVGRLACSLGLIDEDRTLSATELLQTLDITSFRQRLKSGQQKSKIIKKAIF